MNVPHSSSSVYLIFLDPYILIYNILMFLLVSYSLKSSSCSCNSISISSHFCPQCVIFSTAIYLQVGWVPITNDLRAEKRTLSSLPNIGWSLGALGLILGLCLPSASLVTGWGHSGVPAQCVVCTLFQCATLICCIYGGAHNNVCVCANTPNMNVEAQ